MARPVRIPLEAGRSGLGRNDMRRLVRSMAALTVAVLALPGVVWAAETTVKVAACCSSGCCG